MPSVPHSRRLAALVARVAEVQERPPSEAPSSRPNVLRDTFPEQLALIRDPSPLKGAVCTRRAGKSMSVALEFIDDSFSYPSAAYTIVGLHRPDVKRNYWTDALHFLDDKYQLGAKFNESELSMTMPNGARIYLTGADASDREKRKLLGGKNRKIAVDEAQSWASDLRELIYGTLKPSVADFRGSITCIGTPSNMTQGFFHAITRGCRAGHLGNPALREPGWSLHSWTTAENTAIVDGERMCDKWAAEIADLKAANPLVVEVPWFRQNYLGEWCVDEDARVYKYRRERNTFDGELPRFTDKGGRWHFVLAMDLGYNDASAFAILAYHDFDTTLYVIETWKQTRMDITDVANRVKLYEESYAFDSLIIDGANKQAVMEMRRRHGLDLTCADKTGKSDFVELMNAEFIQGRILIDPERCTQGRIDESPGTSKKVESTSLEDEWAGLIWDPRKMLNGRREEHPACPNHLADAVLYGWRHCYQYLSAPPKPAPTPGTPEWFAAEADRAWDEEIAAINARKDEDAEEPRGLVETYLPEHLH